MTPQDKTRRRRVRNVLVAVAACLILAYCIPVAVLYFFQRDLMYIPHVENVGDPSQYGVSEMKVVHITTEDGLALTDWFKPPKNKNGFVIVVFHGSYVNLADLSFVAPYLLKGTEGVFFCEYRGFGSSPGEPTEQGIYNDARAGVNWLLKNGYHASRLAYYGVSMGTGVAVQMASETEPGMIVLQSPYSSVVDIAKLWYPYVPVDYLIKDRFDSMAKIGSVHAPLLIIHGMDDDIVPFTYGKKLFAAANQPKEFYAVHDAAHNDLAFNPAIFKPIHDWITKQEAAQDKAP